MDRKQLAYIHLHALVLLARELLKIQSNAANSEESTSASEELSAQAEEMNRMVRELVAIIGGAGAGSSEVASKQTAAAVRPPPARR